MAVRHSLFDMLQWLSEDAQRAFTAAVRRRNLAAGSLIYQQSDEGDEMFRLVAGSVRLSVMAPDGRDLLYQLFGPGDCFGTSSVIDHEPRPQTAAAFEDVELQVINRVALDELRARMPEFSDALLRLLSRDMRLLSKYFSGAIFNDVELRVVHRLVGIVENVRWTGDWEGALSARLSQSELAAMVGSTRQTVNRVLQNLQDRGLVAVRSGSIEILNLASLKRAVSV